MLRSGHILKSSVLLEQALGEDPGLVEIAATLAEVYVALGRHRRALGCLNRAVSSCPRRPPELAEALGQRGRFLLRRGLLEEGLRDLRAALRWQPENQQLRLQLRAAQRSYYLHPQGHDCTPGRWPSCWQ